MDVYKRGQHVRLFSYSGCETKRRVCILKGVRTSGVKTLGVRTTSSGTRTVFKMTSPVSTTPCKTQVPGSHAGPTILVLDF